MSLLTGPRIPDHCGGTETRILRVLTRLNVGGPARHVAILHHGLRAGGDVSLLVTGPATDHEGDLGHLVAGDVLELGQLRRDNSPLQALRCALRLARVIRQFRPDIVHTHMAMAGFAGRLAVLLSGQRPRVVHTYHGHVLAGYFSPIKQHVYRRMERWLARRSDVLIAVSPAVREELLALHVGTLAQWRVIPLGLEIDSLAALMPADSVRVIGVVGRLAPIKDHRTFLKAVAMMNTQPHVVIAGDGDLRDELEALARSLGIDDRVEFIGWADDLPALYARLGAVVCSSRNEGTPVALIEAMAAGRAVVGTRVGGIPDIVEHEVTGLIVSPGDAHELAGAMDHLVENPAHARALAEAGRAVAIEKFRAERLVADMARLYSELMHDDRTNSYDA